MHQIRLAASTDAAAINELLHQLGYPPADAAATANRIEAWNQDSASAVYVTADGDDILGLVAVHTCPFFERPGLWGRIVALVVSDRARGQGIGSRLVRAAEVFARSRGCVRMEVTSSDHREVAHRFYRNYGFVNQTGRSSRFLRELNGTEQREGQLLH